MTYAGSPQDLPGIVANLAERLRALEARFLIQGPMGPRGPQGPGSFVTQTWQAIGSYTVPLIASPVASVEFLIPTGINHVVVLWKGRSSAAVTNQGMGARFNNSLGNYYFEPTYATDTAVAAGAGIGTSALRVGLIPGTSATAGLYGAGFIFFPNVADSLPKWAISLSGAPTSLIAGGQESQTCVGWWDGTTPITRLLVLPDAGGLMTNSSLWAYGII